MAFDSLLTYTRTQVGTADRLKAAKSAAFILDGWAGEVYSEEAFRHFLEIERTRADRSDRNFLLMLMSLRHCPRAGSQVPRSVSVPLFASLRQSVREVDFIGWYREHRVAGAVLTQGLDLPGSHAPARITDRVTTLVSRRLPVEIADRLRIRVVQLGARALS